MTQELKFRNATIEDAQDLYEWRNDILTRQMSHSQESVDFESHIAWLEKSLTNPERIIYICENKKESIGTIRVDKEKDCAELSWTISPTQRGKGLGSKMLREFIRQYPMQYRAEIRDDNKISKNMAEFSGMVFIECKNNVLHYNNIQAINTQNFIQSVIDEIEQVRQKNNKNWMDILRLAFRYSPKEASAIFSEIYKEDGNISHLSKKLTDLSK